MDQAWVVDFYSDEGWEATLLEEQFDLVTFLLSHMDVPKAVFNMLAEERFM